MIELILSVVQIVSDGSESLGVMRKAPLSGQPELSFIFICSC